jgi:hypothetical protein
MAKPLFWAITSWMNLDKVLSRVFRTFVEA